MKITDEQVFRRLEGRESNREYYRKVHRLRVIVAGDLSSIGPFPQQAAPDDPHKPASSAQPEEFYDVLNTAIETGRSNYLLQTVRTLALQASFSEPRVEFRGLPAVTQELHQAYLAARMHCAAEEMRLALLDYLVSGMGWAGVMLENGMPRLRYFDLLDMNWDRGARLAHAIRWQSCLSREPIGSVIDTFGSKAKALASTFDPRDNDSDARVELEYYYDLEGEGHHYIVARAFDEDGPTILHKGPNPYYRDVAGQRQPYLPIEPMYLLSLPSVRHPVSIVEQMLPAQIGIWQIERAQRERVQKMTSKWVHRNLPESALKALERNEVGGLINLGEEGQLEILEGGAIDPNAIMMRDKLEAEIVGQGGASPFASNSRPSGVEFAAEVHQMAEMGNLMASAITKDVATWWGRLITKFLSTAILYDDEPLKLYWGNREIEFGPESPINVLLRDDAPVVVREDSMTYMSTEARTAKALNDFTVAMQAAAFAPNSARVAYEDYLKAAGITNVESHLAVPVEQPQGSDAVGA